MADILEVIKSSQKKINLRKLPALCSKKTVWDYFDIEKNDFFELSKNRQLEHLNFILTTLVEHLQSTIQSFKQFVTQMG